ncbi:low temperature requirement protein A [Limosilactobacillus reuteri]|uniref:low temperature requirement protein A n=1 Tax=Limosilactobacillus reuteri TaxID=1598 RepID=UPI001E5EC0D0|nr:low temperature requirement protein A [Limosilactobacillus reuteri]MCC4328774.1 low temperature requirement protein A [Limosilactobacillus reuteri]MCC4336541.1 low temperature requirement protein A [Limosilactobacillus reuteri]MCC4339003.1 low temperature requirement protein A [Limosilactobacillus reuteri]
MEKIVAKRVSMLELFYDLIFVYAISRITMMIHHPVNGSLPPRIYLEFIIVVIFVLQIWLYQTVYINRFGTSRIIDTVGLLISMFAAIYLANNINTEWQLTFQVFNLSVALTVVNLIFQYSFGSATHLKKNRDVQAFVITLSLEFFLVVTGLIIGYQYGIYLCIAGGLIGFLMPLVMYRMFRPEQVNFPHLVERLSLIIIITFGETLVNITHYFKGAIYSPLAISIFLGVAALFGIYTLLVERFLNHHQHTRGFIAMYTHVVMIISLLSITAGIIYMTDEEVARLFLSCFVVANLIVFYLCLWLYSFYNRRHLRFNGRDLTVMALVLLLGSLGIVLRRETNLGLMSAFALTNMVEFGLMAWKLQRKKPSKEPHSSYN